MDDFKKIFSWGVGWFCKFIKYVNFLFCEFENEMDESRNILTDQRFALITLLYLYNPSQSMNINRCPL